MDTHDACPSLNDRRPEGCTPHATPGMQSI